MSGQSTSGAWSDLVPRAVFTAFFPVFVELYKFPCWIFRIQTNSRGEQIHETIVEYPPHF